MCYTQRDELKLRYTHSNKLTQNYSLQVRNPRTNTHKQILSSSLYEARQNQTSYQCRKSYNQSLNHFISYFFVDQEITSIRIYHILLRFNTRNNAYLLKDTGIISSQSCQILAILQQTLANHHSNSNLPGNDLNDIMTVFGPRICGEMCIYKGKI